MSLKQYLALMGASTLVSFAALLSVILFFDPYESGLISLVLLYASLFLTVVGIASLLGFVIRYLTAQNVAVFRAVILSARQAVLFSVIICASLLMKQLHVLSALNVTLLVLLMTTLELIFLNKQRI